MSFILDQRKNFIEKAKETERSVWGLKPSTIIKKGEVWGNIPKPTFKIKNTIEIFGGPRDFKRFYGIRFGSKEERDITKKFYNKLDFIPVEGVNVHVCMMYNNKCYYIDWYFEDVGLFAEYHPWDRLRRSLSVYKEERVKLIRANNYTEEELVCWDNIEKIDKFIEIYQQFFLNGVSGVYLK